MWGLYGDGTAPANQFGSQSWVALVTTEVWTVRGLVTYYTIFAIELQSRRVHVVESTFVFTVAIVSVV